MKTAPEKRIHRRLLTLLHIVCLLSLLGSIASPAAATTVIPPEFDSLVQQADYVVRGTVKSVSAELREQNGHRNIVSFVAFEISETIVGTPPQPLVLQMLGGKIDGRRLTVQGAPEFLPGREYILFVRGNGVQFNPLVALMHGQYPIIKDATGRALVARGDGSLLAHESDVALPFASHDRSTAAPRPDASQPAPAALTAAEFSARIRASREKSTAAAAAHP